MRMTLEQTDFILRTVGERAGPGVRVMLFGSRTDDTRRGGDVDLWIESEPPLAALQRVDIQWRLEETLCLPIVDIVVPGKTLTPFQQLVRATAIPLGVTA